MLKTSRNLLISVFCCILCSCNNPYADEMRNYAGNPGLRRAFKILDTYDEVHEFAGDGAWLLSFEAYGVESDGTINLCADYVQKPMVKYHFARQAKQKVPRDSEEKPEEVKIGADTREFDKPAPPPQKPFERVDIYIDYTSGGMGAGKDMRRVIIPVDSVIMPGIAAPGCSLKEIWKKAIKRGAPKNAIANVMYDSNGYVFTIVDLLKVGYSLQSDTIVYMRLDQGCHVTDFQLKPAYSGKSVK